MGPRFIESKKRAKSALLMMKGNRNVRKKRIDKQPAVRRIVCNDSRSMPHNNAEPRSEKFIGGELLEYDDPLLTAARDGNSVTKQKHRSETDRKVPMLARPRRCLGFDSRALLDKSSGQRHGAISNDMNKFMDHLTVRGYNVPVLATTVSDPSQRGKIVKLDKESGTTRELSYVSAISVKASTVYPHNPLEDAIIEAKIGFENNEVTLEEIPNTLTADFTWNLTANLVQSINEKKATEGKNESKDITIVSSELAFFADVDVQAHMAGLDLLVKRLSPLYANGQLDSLQIVLVSSGAVSYSAHDEKSGSYEESLLACIESLRQKMEDLEYQHPVSTVDVSAVAKRVQVSIDRIGSSDIDSLALARRWVRDSICGHNHHLILDLPETADKSQCSVAFDISYQLCPISLTNPYMNDLISDMKCIATRGLEVVQRVPLSSLDASLLFGIPFTLQAGLDSDLDRYRETQTIVSALLRILDDREEALLLSMKKVSAASQSDTHGLFVSGARNPKFIFMTKHAGGNGLPSAAIVFRISSDTDLLAEAGTPSLCNPTIDDDTAIQYTTFLESSLSSLESTAFNPILSPIEPTLLQLKAPVSELHSVKDAGTCGNHCSSPILEAAVADIVATVET